MTPEELKHLCDLTLELTRLKLKEVPHLVIENFSPELLNSFVHAYLGAISSEKEHAEEELKGLLKPATN